MRIKLVDETGDFAGNKDVARDLREQKIAPALQRGEEVALDFAGIDLATQSFIHALVSDLIRRDDLHALDRLVFEHCADDVQSIIEIVVDYSQDDISAA
jgi:STAS-like domain of unknown function (DUF4325)